MKNILVAATVFLTLSVTVNADVPSFSYFQLGSSKMQFDDVDVDLEGYEIEARFSFSDNYYINYERTSMDTTGVDIEIKNIGLGYKSALSPGAVVFVQLDRSYFEMNAGYHAFDLDEDGYRASIGLRNMLTDNLEVNAAYHYLDVGEEISDIFVLGADYRLTDKLSLYADYKLESDYDHMSVGARFKF